VPPTSRLTPVALCTLVLLALAPGVVRGETIHLLTHPFEPSEGEPAIDAGLRAGTPAPGEAAYYLVQLSGPPSEGRKAAIERAGGELVAYVPDHTYIVRMNEDVRAKLEALPAVDWIGRHHPAYRVSPTIGTHELRNPERVADPLLTLTVLVFDRLSETARAIEELGAEVLALSNGDTRKLAVVHATPSLVNAIARIEEVWWIEEKPEFYLTNDTTVWVVQSNVESAMPVWDMGLHGEGQLVAVMDSGLDYNSCWFSDGGAPPGPTHRKVADYATYGGAEYDGCEVGHGTHVCGTLAGDRSYVDPGNHEYNGVAYRARIALQDVGLDDDWACMTGAVEIPDTLTQAYADAYDLGARIHTNSWGGWSNEYNSYCADIDAFTWSHQDFLIVFSAGNGGPYAGSVSYPGTAKNCITVGATRRAPRQHQMAVYSSRGPAFDSRFKPTVTAPGGEAAFAYINSADNDPGNPPAETCEMIDSPFEGTSMAAPAVAGCAALARQYFTEGWYPSGTPTPGDAFEPSAALLKAAIVNCADDMEGEGSPEFIPNYDEGWGRPILGDVLYFYGDARELIIEDVTTGVGQDETETFTFEGDSNAVPVEIVLVWSDHAATAGTALAIQNNINLAVTLPGGGVYKGNVLVGGESRTGGIYDTRNVEEVVRFNRPIVGTYEIEIRGTAVPHAPQPFAVVSTGSFADWPGGTGIDEGDVDGTRRAFEIEGVTPNPFNPSTTITYRLFPVATGEARATLKVYGVDGRLVATLVDRVQDQGKYSVTWNGRDAGGFAVASGVYLLELSYGGENGTRKITLLK